MKLRLAKREIPPHLLRFFRPVGFKPKDEIDMPNMVCEALREDGWYRRCTIIWNKPNPMPESVTDRPTKSHEYIFLLSKSAQYFYDGDAIKEPSQTDPNTKASMMFGSPNGKNNTSALAHAVNLGHKWDYEPTRNKRTVWTVTTNPYAEAHFATFPPKLIEPCILAGSREGDTVLDPFCGNSRSQPPSHRHSSPQPIHL